MNTQSLLLDEPPISPGLLPPVPATSLPPQVQAVVDAWRGYKALADDYWQRFLNLRDIEKAARGLDESESYLLILNERSAEPKISEIAEQALRRMVWLAESYFAPTGARLTIGLPDSDELPCADPENLDLLSVWTYLEANYGGALGARKAYGDIAKKLGDRLSITVGCEPKIVSGRACFNVTTYSDRIFENIISHNDSETLNGVLYGFLAVGEWSGMWSANERGAVRSAREDIDKASRGKILPDRRNIGDSVLIIYYKSKVEYRISPAFAEKMQLFLTEFDGFRKSRW